jgi:hypothetical protein
MISKYKYFIRAPYAVYKDALWALQGKDQYRGEQYK